MIQSIHGSLSSEAGTLFQQVLEQFSPKSATLSQCNLAWSDHGMGQRYKDIFIPFFLSRNKISLHFGTIWNYSSPSYYSVRCCTALGHSTLA